MGEISPATVAFAPQRPPPPAPRGIFRRSPARASDRHGQALEAPPLRLPAPHRPVVNSRGRLGSTFGHTLPGLCARLVLVRLTPLTLAL